MRGWLPRNPEPRRPILKNLRFSSLDTVDPDILNEFRLSEHVTRVVVKQAMYFCSCIADACLRSKKRFTVGFIGCGRMGKAILDAYLKMGLDPKDIFVSTRRPEILEKYEGRGVKCVYDNSQVARKARLLLLCTLPAHVQRISSELRGNIRKTTVFFSIVAALSTVKLRQLFGTTKEQTLRTAIDMKIIKRVYEKVGMSSSSSSSSKFDDSIVISDLFLAVRNGESITLLIASIESLVKRLGYATDKEDRSPKSARALAIDCIYDSLTSRERHNLSLTNPESLLNDPICQKAFFLAVQKAIEHSENTL
eukprot:g1179.t1